MQLPADFLLYDKLLFRLIKSSFQLFLIVSMVLQKLNILLL